MAHADTVPAHGQGFDAARFCATYQRSVDDVFAFLTPAMQLELARHCHGWRPGAMDFRAYFAASELRYAIACESLHEHDGLSTLCDVGGFFGVFALTLARLGYPIAMTEALAYYSQAFTPLFRYLADNGVRIINYDPFGSAPPENDRFDTLTVMAVLEHYPHSLEIFMANVMHLLKPGGKIYIEVPNIAYWPKRRALLAGRTPLVPVSDIYRSAVPFIGHHHEFTLTELHELARLAGLSPIAVRQYNYSFRGPFYKRLISDPLLCLMSVLPSMRECLAILARRA
ncbi:MAG: methyltransferase domain-containing protein [Rhodocyclaceae bacterium]|nr:methyltransferase domain-containing protein [Rhodocyclaceae bacterium]MBX3667280.1 methyltransferase domain-containing protein [Rhodocyclaceae bacterium]